MKQTGILTVLAVWFSLWAGLVQACPNAADLTASGVFPDTDLSDCIELANFDIPTGRGPIAATIFGYADTDRTKVAETQAALIQSGTTLQGLGPFSSYPVEIYLSQDLVDPSSGLGDASADAARSYNDDGVTCLIVAFADIFSSERPTVIAHEFFHCVQQRDFDRQNRSTGADWWVEGTAEWFATLAYPDTEHSDQYVAGFDTDSPDTGITGMAYENVVFFWWLSQNYGANKVIELIRAMPVGGASQDDALAGFLDEGAFLNFLKDYMDENITQPGGRAIASNPFIGDFYVIEEDREVELEAARFVLFRVRIQFKCGGWELRETAHNGRYEVQRQPTGMWESLPAEVRSETSADFEYMLAGIGTGSAGFSTTIDIKKKQCVPCLFPDLSDEPASCLVGAWHLTSGGYGAKIGAMLERVPDMQNVDYPDIDGFLTLNADGSFTLRADDTGSMETVTPDGEVFTGDVDFRLEQHGTWSVNGAQLEQCYVRDKTINIDLLITDPDGDSERIIGDEYLGPRRSYTTKRRFNCAGNRLEITEGGFFSLVPTINWVYEK